MIANAKTRSKPKKHAKAKPARKRPMLAVVPIDFESWDAYTGPQQKKMVKALAAAGVKFFNPETLDTDDWQTPEFAEAVDRAGYEILGPTTAEHIYTPHGIPPKGQAQVYVGKPKDEGWLNKISPSITLRQKRVKKVIKPVAFDESGYHITDVMNDKLQDLFQEANIPRKDWAKAARDVAVVLKVTLASDGKASAIRPPSQLPISALPPEEQDSPRQKNTLKVAKRRKNKRARAMASPALG
jgi:hypothetical protein